MPAEFLSTIQELTSSGQWQVILESGRPQTCRLWDGAPESLLAVPRIFLTVAGPISSDVLAEKFSTAVHGWVAVDVPRETDLVLLGIQIGARSDWWDPAMKSVRENPETVKRFDRVWRKFKPKLTNGVLVRNIRTGAEEMYDDIWYSKGVSEWVAQGGQLRREGVANQVYLIPSTRE